MRRPSLRGWLRRELIALSGLERISAVKMAAAAQGPCPRLREPLLLFYAEQGRAAKLLELVYRDDVRAEYEEILRAIAGRDLTELALEGNAGTTLPRAYAKHLKSFAADYRRADTNAESKRIRRDRCNDLRMRKGVTITQMCRDLGYDAGNVCAFLKRGELGRMTLADATAMMKYLMAAG